MMISLCLEKRVLVHLHQSPEKSTRQLWIDIVPLCHSDFYLLCPFNFEPRSDVVRPNKCVAREIRDSLLLLCNSFLIVPLFYLYPIKN